MLFSIESSMNKPDHKFSGNISTLGSLFFVLMLVACTAGSEKRGSLENNEEALAGLVFELPGQPESYVCYRANMPPEWTNPFADITGNRDNQPAQQTRVKMLWDDENFYFAAELEEKHVRATLRQRDTVIYYDNDFEIFIDPDGDTHLYYELEVNAFGTVWDLLMVKPYRDGGPAISGWNISGLKVGVNVEGTINNPESDDKNWTVEIAMPWQILKECAPGHRKPSDGEQWRVNFSRVDWEWNLVDGRYVKRIDPDTGDPLPPLNRTWSPQERVNMHAPETWGYVQFSDILTGEQEVLFLPEKDEEIKWVLRKLYHLQRSHYINQGKYAASLEGLGLQAEDFNRYPALPEFSSTPSMYRITMSGYTAGITWQINQEGKVWKSKVNKEKVIN
jgi:hypothetical protein